MKLSFVSQPLEDFGPNGRSPAFARGDQGSDNPLP